MSEGQDPLLVSAPTPDVPALHDLPAPPSPLPESASPLPQHELHGLLPAIQSLLYIIVIAVFILSFTVQPFRIPSGSMEPTLLVGDFLLVNKHSLGFDEPRGILPASSIHRGQIVIFHYPIDPTLHLIKRVIGMPGDHLRLRGGRVSINGQPLQEPYAVYRPGPADSFRDEFPHLQATAPDIDPAWWIRMHTLVDNGELIIPAGDYFVLGDNRNGSEDSRYWGFVPRENIVGTPLLIYFSLRPLGVHPDLPHPELPRPDLPHPDRQADPASPNPLNPDARYPDSRYPGPRGPGSQSPGSLSPWLSAIVDFARWDRIFLIPR